MADSHAVICSAVGGRPRTGGNTAESCRAVEDFAAAGFAADGDAPSHDLAAAVRAAQCGDEAAFRVLYRDLQPRLLRYLVALVDEDADDVAAEAWLHIARDLGNFRGDTRRFRAWVTTIARHRAIDHLRREDRRPPAGLLIEDLHDLAGPHDTARSALDRVAADDTVSLIAALPPGQAEAVLLRVVLGLDAAQAARVLGKRPGAVRTATHRGLRTLAQHLQRPGGAR
jgi:RNA polymerase sigma-70 factor (ECF subfamily)